MQSASTQEEEQEPRCPSCNGVVTPVNPQQSHFYCEQCAMAISAERCFADTDEEDES